MSTPLAETLLSTQDRKMRVLAVVRCESFQRNLYKMMTSSPVLLEFSSGMNYGMRYILRDQYPIVLLCAQTVSHSHSQVVESILEETDSDLFLICSRPEQVILKGTLPSSSRIKYISREISPDDIALLEHSISIHEMSKRYCNSLSMNPTDRTVRSHGILLPLHDAEYDILAFMLESPDGSISYEQAVEHSFIRRGFASNTLETIMKRIDAELMLRASPMTIARVSLNKFALCTRGMHRSAL